MPLTVGAPGQNPGVGYVLLVARHAHGAAARFSSPVGVYHCSGARSAAGDARLARAYRGGGHEGVRSLRRDSHAESRTCWLHTPSFCLSAAGAPCPGTA